MFRHSWLFVTSAHPVLCSNWLSNYQLDYANNVQISLNHKIKQLEAANHALNTEMIGTVENKEYIQWIAVRSSEEADAFHWAFETSDDCPRVAKLSEDIRKIKQKIGSYSSDMRLSLYSSERYPAIVIADRSNGDKRQILFEILSNVKKAYVNELDALILKRIDKAKLAIKSGINWDLFDRRKVVDWNVDEVPIENLMDLISNGFGDLLPAIKPYNMWEILQHLLFCMVEGEDVADIVFAIHKCKVSVDWMALAYYHQFVLVPSKRVSSLFTELVLNPSYMRELVSQMGKDITIELKVGDDTHTLPISSTFKLYQLFLLIEEVLHIPVRNQLDIEPCKRFPTYFTDSILLYEIGHRSEVTVGRGADFYHLDQTISVRARERILSSQLPAHAPILDLDQPDGEPHRLRRGLLGNNEVLTVLQTREHYDLIDRACASGPQLPWSDFQLSPKSLYVIRQPLRPKIPTLLERFQSEDLRIRPNMDILIQIDDGPKREMSVHSEMTLGDLIFLIRVRSGSLFVNDYVLKGHSEKCVVYERLYELGIEQGDVVYFTKR